MLLGSLETYKYIFLKKKKTKNTQTKAVVFSKVLLFFLTPASFDVAFW